MSSQINLSELSDKIAYITINPSGNFLKSAQKGFEEVGLYPKHLIYVRPTNRLKKEFKKYKLSFFSKFLIPQLKRFMGNKKSFDQEVVKIPIPNRHMVSKLNSPQTAELLEKLGIRYLVNCGAGIFRKQIISIPDMYILNAHAGKLPDYKNMNVVEWAVCNGDEVVGTIHEIDTGIDTGAVWLEKKLVIYGANNLLELREKCFDQVIKMYGKAVIMNEKGLIDPKKHHPVDGKKWYRMHSFYQKEVDKILEGRKQ